MTRTLSTIFVFTFTLLLTAVTAPAQSQRTFVSTSGNDANTASLCSAANPCRTFSAAFGVTNTNGEIYPLTSGGYGPLTINKGVTIASPTGINGGITGFTGDAITVAAPGAKVILRGLLLNSQGGTIGINVTAVGALHVESCIVDGFSSRGISVSLTADSSEIFIKDTIVRNGGNNGIFIETTTGTITASISNCRAENNVGIGFYVLRGSEVTISNSVASGNGQAGFMALGDGAGASAEMNVEQCVASNNDFGFVSQGNNPATAMMRVARSIATNNNTNGFAQFGTSTFESRGDNLVRGNGTNTVGSITVVASS